MCVYSGPKYNDILGKIVKINYEGELYVELSTFRACKLFWDV